MRPNRPLDSSRASSSQSARRSLGVTSRRHAVDPDPAGPSSAASDSVEIGRPRGRVRGVARLPPLPGVEETETRAALSLSIGARPFGESERALYVDGEGPVPGFEVPAPSVLLPNPRLVPRRRAAPPAKHPDYLARLVRRDPRPERERLAPAERLPENSSSRRSSPRVVTRPAPASARSSAIARPAR